jgi:hypothetical protein
MNTVSNLRGGLLRLEGVLHPINQADVCGRATYTGYRTCMAAGPVGPARNKLSLLRLVSGGDSLGYSLIGIPKSYRVIIVSSK